MSNLYNMNALRNKKKATEPVAPKQPSRQDDTPFTGFYFMVGEEAVEIGKALFNDLFPFIKENLLNICNAYVVRYADSVLGEDKPNPNQLSEADKIMHLVHFRDTYIKTTVNTLYEVETFEEIGALLDTPEGTHAVATVFGTGFYLKYNTFDINTLVKKNWILVNPTFAKYLAKEKEKLDADYSLKTSDEVTEFLQIRMLESFMGKSNG